jgi:hypothetical protein
MAKKTVGDTLAKELEEFEAAYNETDSDKEMSGPPADDVEEAVGSTEAPETTTEKGDEAPDRATGEATDEPDLELLDADTYAMPDFEEFGELRGKRVTLEQLRESGLLNKLLTRNYQELNMMKRWDAEHVPVMKEREALSQRVELLTNALNEVMRDGARSQPGGEPGGMPAPEQIAMASQAIAAQWVPRLKKVSEATGAIEPELLELAPNYVSATEYRFDGLNKLGTRFDQRLKIIEDYILGNEGERQHKSSQETFEEMAKDVAGRHELFGSLKEKKVVDEFRDWMLNEDTTGIRAMAWEAFNADTVETAFRNFLRSEKGRKYIPRKKDKTVAQLARGAGGASAGVGRGAGKQTDEFAQFEKEYRESMLDE